MILLVSHIVRERTAFAALFEDRGWPTLRCESVRAVSRLLRRSRPRVVITRQRLGDGYSDDIIALLKEARLLPATRIIVLAAAGTPSTTEVRQLALGADCLLRDPVRTEVLLAYLLKFHRPVRAVKAESNSARDRTLSFSGATVHPIDRLLQHDQHSISLTPREVQLIELLVQSPGEILTYDQLYHEILSRHFAGDTSNMRVLLRKLSQSVARVGIVLPQWVEVIPKTGYRYQRSLPRALRSGKSRSPRTAAA